MIDEIVVGFEDAIGEPVIAHELPYVLDRIELRAFRRQGDNGDIGRDLTAFLYQRMRDYCIGMISSRWLAKGANVCGAGGL